MTYDEYLKELEKLKADMPKIMDTLIKGEGEFAVKQAKLMATTEEPDTVNTGFYRNSFHYGRKNTFGHGEGAGRDYDGSKSQRKGEDYSIDVYNSAEYAIHLEYGFRAHFVPGYWQGSTFVYDPAAREGMFVGKPGGYVPGKYHLRNALAITKRLQDARLSRKIKKELRRRGLNLEL